MSNVTTLAIPLYICLYIAVAFRRCFERVSDSPEMKFSLFTASGWPVIYGID